MYIRPYLNTHAGRDNLGSVVLLEFSISTYSTKSTNVTTIQLLLLFFVILAIIQSVVHQKGIYKCYCYKWLVGTHHCLLEILNKFPILEPCDLT